MAHIKKYSAEIALLAVILLLYAAHSVYFNSSLVNYATDEISSIHSSSMPEMAEAFTSGSPAKILAGIKDSKAYMMGYQPFCFAFAYAITLLFGRDWMLINLIQNAFFMVILLLSAYGLGRVIKDRNTGILSALIIALLPLVYGTFTSFLIDFALMCLTPAAIYALYRSNLFKDTGWSVVFGLLCGWAMLVKYPFIAYITGPAVYCFLQSLLGVKNGNASSLRNSGTALLITAAMMAPFYFYPDKLNYLLAGPSIEATGTPWYVLGNLKYFALDTFSNQLSLPFFVAFTIGVFFFFRKEVNKHIRWIVALWILVPGVIILLVPHWKSSRYFMPVLPAYALISAVGLASLLNRKWGRILVVVVFAAGIMQFFLLTYPEGMVSKKYFENSIRGRFYPKWHGQYYHCDATLPLYLRKEHSEFLNTVISKLPQKSNKDKSGGVLTIFSPSMAINMFRYQPNRSFLWFQGIDVEVFHVFSFKHYNIEPQDIDLIWVIRNNNWRKPDTVNNPTYDDIRMDNAKLSNTPQVSEEDWGKFQELMKEFTKRELVFENNICSVFFYSR